MTNAAHEKIVMSDRQYLDRAEALLRAVEVRCDELNDVTDVDIDNQRTGGMVTLSFPDGSQIVINLQKPLQEVWLAARSGGYHFAADAVAWRDTKTGEEFAACLTRCASEHAGMAVDFSAL